MNILIVHNYYKYAGGEDSVFKNEVKALRESGHKVITYTRSNSELNNQSLLKKMFIPFIYIFNIRTYKELKKIIEQEQIDIVHVHNTLSLISYSVYYAAFCKKIPVVQTVHNFRFVCPNALLFKNSSFCDKCIRENSYKSSIANGCYHGSKIHTFLLVVALLIHKRIGTLNKLNYIFLTKLSSYKFSQFIDLNSSSIYIKGNFVDGGYFDRVNVNLNKFIFVGRLEEGKGILDLLDYWECVNSEAKLIIYGDGPLKDKVKTIADKKSNVIYEGKKSNSIILSELADSCAMVFSSKYFENLPMTIVESFSVGCPVIAYSMGNGENIVRISNGGNIYGDGNSLSLCVQDVINNNLFYSENAYSYYMENFTKKKNIDHLVSIYKDLIDKGCLYE